MAFLKNFKEKWGLEETLEKKQKNIKQQTINKNASNNQIDWGWIGFLIVIFCAIVLPILIILFNVGPTETADTKEEMEQQFLDGNPWSGY